MMEFKITLNSPLSEEDLDMIYDVDMDNTSVVTFHTKHGKEVEFVKVVRCKDCKWYKTNYSWNGKEHKICAKEAYEPRRNADDFCSYGERK